MAHHVYANGMEIASRSSDGKSAAAFPDTCFSPPTPPATGVPIPYSNTCFAKDITNGSTSVFIKGKSVGLADESYFKTSVGDDPATKGLKKGIVSGAVNGKAYFVHWSPNVKVEGFGVPRHLDSVTHNHSNPSNTALFPFQSRSWFLGRHDCMKEEKRIEKACKSKKAADKDKHWTEENCKGLGAQVGNGKIDDIKAELENNISHLQDQLKNADIVKQISDKFAEEVIDWGTKQAGIAAMKAVGKQAIGSLVPVVGNIAMGASTAADLYSLQAQIRELTEQAAQIEKYAAESAQKLTEAQKNLDNMFKDGKVNVPDLDTKEGQTEFRKQVGDIQDGLATLNDCTRARKCNLVPYGKKSTDGRDGTKKTESSQKHGKGCCQGQTGHHLLPDGMTRDSGCTIHRNRGGQSVEAPTVCVEGGVENGSHGRVHNAMDTALKKAANDGKIVNDKISLDDALEAATDSHMKAFPLSLCSKKCIRSQLDDYYKKACNQKNPQLNAKDKNGKKFEPVTEDN